MAREYTREIYLYINGKKINNDIKSIRAEMQLLVNEQAKMVVGSKDYVTHGEKIRSLKGVLNEHTAQLKNVNRSWGQSMNAMGDWFNRFQAVGVAAIATIIGVVMAFRKTAEASNLIEERLDNLSALTGLTGRQLEWLGQKAKDSSVSITETGVRIKQSASDIVDAYTKVGSQRPELLKNKESLAAVTEAAIILSEAAKSKLEPATEALTTTMNQFNLGANHANRIINTLAAGSLIGAGEIPYLTETLEKSGTTANLMGISIEEMTGIVEGIAPKFANARRAGTSLDRVLLKMRATGIGFKDGVFDVSRALDELNILFKNGESSVDLFGLEHAKMGEVLVMNREVIRQYTAEVTGTQVAFEQAGKNTDNMAAKLAQAKNKVTLMYIEIGQKLAPALIFSTNTLNILLRSMMALPEILSKNRVLVVSLVGALLAYNSMLIKSIAVSAFKAVADKLQIRSTALQILMTEAQTGQTAKLTLVQKAAVVTQWLLNAAMSANPLGVVIVALTAVVAATMAYARHNKAAIAMDERKKLITDNLASANKALEKTYQSVGDQMNNLNRLSIQEKKDLQDKITKSIELAEISYMIEKSRRDNLRTENVGLNAWQFLTTWSNEGKLAKARANGLKFVATIDEGLQTLTDKIQGYKDQRLTLDEILTAETTADSIGSRSITMMEEKLSLYQLALSNTNVQTEEFIRIRKKAAAVEAQLSKARGSNLGGGVDEEFKRKEALADIEEFHTRQLALIKGQYAKGEIEKEYYLDLMDQEEIRFQTASIKRLKSFGQSTAEEEEKIQNVLLSIREEKEKQAEELWKSLDDQQKDMFKAWDDEHDSYLKNLQSNDPHWTDSEKQKILEWQYWLESNAEGQKAKLDSDLSNNLISLTEYHDQVRALDKETTEKKFQQLEDFARATGTMLDAVTTMNEAAKNRELATAGLNDKQKEGIEKKYALRQQKMAIAQTIIEGILEVARVNSNSGVNADLTQTLRLMLTGAAVARTVAGVALIQSQQFATGKYPVKGASDGRIYQAAMMGNVKTGYYTKPTLGLFSEREPEIVIDGPTTRNIKANFPEILGAINAARVNQYAGGMYPDLGGTSQQSAMQITALLQANMQMMRQVILAHEKPGTVSFSSIRDTQAGFDFIKAKTTI